MTATLRLKMRIASLKQVCDTDGKIMAEEIALAAVYGPEGSPNSQWSKWTPAAQLTMTINNLAAFGKVLPEQFYFVDLIPTDKDAI